MGNKKRKTRTKRGAGPDPNLTDWKSGKPMKVCKQQVKDSETKCNAKCGKAYWKKEVKNCKSKEPLCKIGSCESQETKNAADALVKGIKKCDLKGVKMYNACKAVCPDKSADFGKRMDPDTDCYPKHPECNFTKMQNWTRQRREVICKKWEPGGKEYAEKQMNAKDDCAHKSWNAKVGEQYRKNTPKYLKSNRGAGTKYVKKNSTIYPDFAETEGQSTGTCQIGFIENDFCKGSIVSKGKFSKTYGVKCEVNPDVAYKKNPKECLKCGGRRSKHKRTKKKTKRKRTKRRRTKKKTKRRRTKRRRTKRR